ncbi:M20 aminoacylase family protein [Hoeflea sp. CAU 1731]
MVLVEDVRGLKSLVDIAVDLRRDIHMHPETAFEEKRTAGLVADRLRELGITVHTGLAGTGVVGVLEGLKPGTRTIGLRADMDALFIQEDTGLPYQSIIDGKMHACGHDGHTAMLLGAAEYLAKRNDFSGVVVFIFQPAEESEGGAREMIKEGLFQRFPCDAIYGMHNMPGMPAGHFAIKHGPLFAAGDTWQVVFEGTGGHGAFPDRSTDPSAALGAFLSSYQHIISRRIPAREAAILRIGFIEGGNFSSPNIIPSEILVRGTARSYTAQIRDRLEKNLDDVARSCAAVFGCTARSKYQRRYPPLINHAIQTEIAIQAARSVAGSTVVDADTSIQGGSEDFAFMLEERPGAYILMGNGDGPDAPFVHTPKYDFNDDVIPHGIAYWVNLVAEELDESV